MTEDEVRQLTAKHNLRLRRSSVTDPRVPGYGIYWLHDASTGLLVFPDSWGAELDQVAKWLECSQGRT